MKEKKMKISNLQLKSFVTDLSEEKENTVKGGATTTFTGTINTWIDFCLIHSLDGFCEKFTDSICPTRDVAC